MATSLSPTNRIAFFDNLKGILIYLVVIGHFLLPVHDENRVLDFLYQLIYVFHMPLFVFVSGFFAKSVFKDGKLKVDKIISCLVLGLLFQIALIGINQSDKPLSETLLDLNAAPWYLFSLAFWYASTPFFARIKPSIAIAASIVIALVAGCFDELGDFLALSRTVCFLPFFLLGYYCSKDSLLKVKNSKWIVISIMAAVAFAILLACFQDFFSRWSYISLAHGPYKSSDSKGIMARIGYMVAAVILSLAVIKLTPRRKTFLVALGERTLQIYVLHRIIRRVLSDLGLYQIVDTGGDPFLGVLFIVVVSSVVTAVCAIPVLKVPFDALFRAKWTFLLRRNETAK